jgi:hypothetical protein
MFDSEASQMVAISDTCSLSAAQLCRCTEAVSYLLADCCRCTSIVWNSRERKLSSLLLTRVQKPLLVGWEEDRRKLMKEALENAAC